MLIFDFDGVLIDSLDEVTLTVYNAATGGLRTSLSSLPAGLVQLFKRNRFHVQPIGDGLALMNWCLANYQHEPGKILTSPEYQTIVAGASGALHDRTRLIYEKRSLLIDRDLESWVSLHRPFQPLWSQLIGHPGQAVLILTHKNKAATVQLCRYFGFKIEAKDIYSGDHSVTKVENMQRIQHRFGAQAYFFLDDSVKNLRELSLAFNQKEKVLELLFASWGYTGPEDEVIARSYGYPVFKQADMISFLNQSRPAE